MPTFDYQGVDELGNPHQGLVDGPGLLQAAGALRDQGILSFRLESTEAPDHPISDHADAFSFFNRSLAGMLQAGVPLPDAVLEIAKSLPGKKLRTALQTVENGLREGRSLDQALEPCKDTFPPHYIWMIRAGLEGNKLPDVLVAIARSTESDHGVRRGVVEALAYPLLTITFGLVFFIGFIWKLLPTYQNLYQNIGSSPAAIQTISGVNFSLTQIFGAIATLVLTVILVLWFTKASTKERLLFRIPIVGLIWKRLALYRFLSCLAVLVNAKISLPNAILVSIGASGSRHFAEAAQSIHDHISDGAGLSEVLSDVSWFPEELVTHFALAEQTGRLPETISEMAVLQNHLSNTAADTIYMVLFPTAMVVTGLLVGTALIVFSSLYFDLVKMFFV